MLNRLQLFFLIASVFFCSFDITAKQIQVTDISENTILNISDTLILSAATPLADSLLHKTETKKEKNKKKFVSALLAFPFPFGFMGAHRVMLGTKPWVPVVYVATFGGCFGILPLIDFFVIVCSKDISIYENSSTIFMWVK